MLEVLIPMAVVIAVGSLLRVVRPMGMDADATRKSLTSLVYLLLLPALVLDVIWQAPLSFDSIRIIALAVCGVLSAVLIASIVFRGKWLSSDSQGALILAAAWANVTYLGLPVLEQTFGSGARSIAIQYDLLANTPLLLTLGVWVAKRYGYLEWDRSHIAEMARVPAFWAVLLAVTLNYFQVAVPDVVDKVLTLLGNSVPPLMLLALGMGLRWDVFSVRVMPAIFIVVLIQLFITPLLIYWLSSEVGLRGDVRAAVILEAAMPTMVLGMVICDRYRLNTGLFAAATTVTTALSLVTLPLWYWWIT